MTSARMPQVLESLPAALAARLWADASLLAAPAGKTLVALGATSTSVYIVLEGRVQVMLFSLGGKEVILRDLGEGDIFGELAAIDGQPRSASIVALADCQLASIPAETFRAAVSALPEGAIWLARRLTGQIRDLTERVFELNALRVRSRLHCELLRLCGTAADGRDRITLEPTPTHAELASRVGTHREAVTREIGLLVGQGIVEQHRRRMTVVDLPALTHLVRMATSGEDA
jgi:CRP/FNR family transcriptional regulator, cyclic AMP receptor protein